MSILTVDHVSKTYGEGADAVTAIGDVSLTVEQGEFVSVVGPSGCGKTTLLNLLAGLLRPTSGRAVMEDQPIDGPPANVAVVFQKYERSLLPWSTNLENVVLPLRNMSFSRDEQQERALVALRSVGLESVVDQYPWQLSGGMQQRVALARAVAYEPHLLLMDEPFASVDAQTRAELEDLTLRVRAEFDVTVLLVTHDIDEAVYMADRVVVLGGVPTEVTEIVDVPLGRPRSQMETKADPAFVDLRTHVLGRIMDSTSSSSARQNGVSA